MRIFGSAAAGAALFAACFISSLLIAIFVFRTGERIVLASADTKYDLGSACFVSSVMSAARVMYTVCAMIIGFSAVTAVLDIAGVASAAAKLIGSDAVFSSIMEISRVQSLPLKDFTMPICAALLSFGGVCVILQICALTADSLQMRGFLLSRLPAAIFSAVFAVLFSKLLPEGWLTSPQTHQVYAPTGAETQLFSVNAGMSVCVLIMCGLLLLGAQKKSCD